MFINATLLDRVAYGFGGGGTWATKRYQLLSGRSKRNAQRSMPLYRYTAPYRNIRPEHYEVVVAAYNACLGPVHSFRFKDWFDYTINNAIIGTATGATDETMQIVKPYTFGTTTLNRVITKPIAGGTLTADDAPLAHTLDDTTGIVTFNTTVGKVIRATYEFDVPVHFDDDDMDFDFDTWEHMSSNIVLVEDFNA